VKIDRREWLAALAGAPVLALLARPASATDYASAGELLDAVDRLEAGVAGRLRAIAAAHAPARPLARSFLAGHARHRSVRARVRRRLGLEAVPAPGEAVSDDRGLQALRDAQEALVYAHAEGLPALGDALAVELLARNMVELSRQLTVLDLWLEAEAERG
jgi:hypothetical protein